MLGLRDPIIASVLLCLVVAAVVVAAVGAHLQDLNYFGEQTTGYKVVGRRQTKPGPTSKDW